MAEEYKGRCRCGKIVARFSGMPDFSVYCHCDDCRRATGAPVLASIGVHRDALYWDSRETLKEYKDGTASRLFCSHCGSPVAQLHESVAEKVFLNTCFMENPEAFPPTAHTFEGEQLGWLELHDDLARYERTILINRDGGLHAD